MFLFSTSLVTQLAMVVMVKNATIAAPSLIDFYKGGSANVSEIIIKGLQLTIDKMDEN